MSCAGIIVAGGRGRRFGGWRPKQFQLLRERPLLMWTLDAFERCPCIDSLVLVVPAGTREATEQMLAEHGLSKRVMLCDGGPERVDSVRNGLAAVSRRTKLVAVHDAARPLVSSDLIERVVEAAEQSGAAIAALPSSDTIKMGREGQIERTLARGQVFAAQTPQAFRASVLRKAYRTWEQGDRAPVTDDAQLIELMGHPVRLVTGEASNIKITVADDLALAEALLAKDTLHVKLPRTGMGYDVHRLVPERRLVLGGVDIAYEKGLEGHSDADVLSHAIGDAVLGAAGLGDLGSHFPPGDPCYRDADSLKLLARIRQMTQQAGYQLANVDSVIVCQAPKLAPHIQGMRSRLAAVLQIDVDRVSVKATTTEGLGPMGREEGIASYATATLVPR